MHEPFDPRAALAPPPDPWVPSSMPSLRDGPPFHMTDMIAAEPQLARRVLGRLLEPGSAAARLATEIRRVIEDGGSIVVTGCGTSEHAAIGVAEILRDAVRGAGVRGADRRITAEQALEASLAASFAAEPRDLVVGVSHEGGSAATNAALAAARDAGAGTALLTAGGGSPGAALASIVVQTGEMDASWCHTIGYVSPLLAATAVAAHLVGRRVDPEAVASLLAGATDEPAAGAVAPILAGTAHLVVIGSGVDRAAGRELVLKVEEAAWLPSAFRDLETFLHGHLPASGPDTGLVLVLTDRQHRAERIERARQALGAAQAVGLRTAAILARDVTTQIDEVLTPAGRLIVPEAPNLPASVAALLGAATAVQVLTERIARARGTNPDPIRRGDERYRRAAEVGDGA